MKVEYIYIINGWTVIYPSTKNVNTATVHADLSYVFKVIPNPTQLQPNLNPTQTQLKPNSNPTQTQLKPQLNLNLTST